MSLTCKAVGDNNLVYRWTHNDSFITPNNHYVLKGSDLLIVNATMLDAGRYQCIATNSNGSVFSNYATVIVAKNGKLHIVWKTDCEIHYVLLVPAPQIIIHPTDTSAAAPFSAVFTCSARGYGYLNITWFKNNKVYYVITDKSRIHQTSSMNVTSGTLVIHNVTEDDMGMYHCQVWASRTASQSRTANLFFSGMYTLTLLNTCSVIQ